MSGLLEQFLIEARDFLQTISEKLLALENDPENGDLVTELFRAVHTLKGNSGLFDFPEMTRVLHAAEDLMDAVRDRRLAYNQELADELLAASDFVAMLLDEIEANGQYDASHAEQAAELAERLRERIPEADVATPEEEGGAPRRDPRSIPLIAFGAIPEAVRQEAFRAAASGGQLHLLAYQPEEEAFFKGEDPFYLARQTPGVLWAKIVPRAPWPPLPEFDCYRCVLDFHLLCLADHRDLVDHYRYVLDQVRIEPISPAALIVVQGEPGDEGLFADFVLEARQRLAADDLAAVVTAAQNLATLVAPHLAAATLLRWLIVVAQTTPEDRQLIDKLLTCLANGLESLPGDMAPMPKAVEEMARESLPADDLGQATKLPTLPPEDLDELMRIVAVQEEILSLSTADPWWAGRLEAVATVLRAASEWFRDEPVVRTELSDRLSKAKAMRTSEPLAQWLASAKARWFHETASLEPAASAPISAPGPSPTTMPQDEANRAAPSVAEPPRAPSAAPSPRAASPSGPPVASHPVSDRRDEPPATAKVLKVDQAKVDRLMNLIGEMVVAKNALPYLANRAENQYGVRELSRELKAHYAVINRIAEEMQDAIMQVRMLPLSFVLQRFPRLVRDIARKLGKEVELVLEGEETEADKSIVEALGDPMIHLVRNSLDHGLEPPDEREEAGKPRQGRLVIRAQQESDRVIIEVVDDGRGIDPEVIKRKAYEKGLIDEARLDTLTDREAIHLIFLPGFSTAETVSDLSGRGVGMDVVRSSIERVGGSIELTSERGRGTRVRLSLPLSMAVTNVMVIESNRQIFGVPMDQIVETVRIPVSRIAQIKRQQAVVLRGRVVPLFALNDLLAIAVPPCPNADGEYALLLVRVNGAPVGLLVDAFREVVDVILKPLPGALGSLPGYAGTALLGDGSVLMVLNPKELLSWR